MAKEKENSEEEVIEPSSELSEDELEAAEGQQEDDNDADFGEQIREGMKGIHKTMVGIGEVLGETMKTVLSDREHVIMVRVNTETRDHIDKLMQAGILKSRSEAAAFLLASGIHAHKELFDRIHDKTEEIGKIQEELRDLIIGYNVEKDAEQDTE